MCPLPSSLHGREPPGLCRLWQSCAPTPSQRRRRTSPSAPGEGEAGKRLVSMQLCGPQTTHRVHKPEGAPSSASTVRGRHACIRPWQLEQMNIEVFYGIPQPLHALTVSALQQSWRMQSSAL